LIYEYRFLLVGGQMIYFNELDLSKEILNALEQLQIDYVFQPIFEPDGKTIFAREALMRPKEMSVTELIEKYTVEDKLHIIEIATFFGAMQAFVLRGYQEMLSINSFPSESFDENELQTFLRYYGKDVRGKLIIEMLEYPSFSLVHWVSKHDTIKELNQKIALDDFGTGINDMGKVNFIGPDIVKLDRSLISNIDSDILKQENCKAQIEILHQKNIMVVAEGVETKEEFDYLVSIGTDLFQGYYLARPA